MADFYFVRHGSNDYLGKALAGRLENVHLNDQGRAEAELTAGVFATLGIQRIISSPLERALETAEPLATKTGLKIEIAPEIVEIDFGDWTGKEMKELEASPAWNKFNLYRSGTRIPNGETMIEAQARMIAFLEKLRRENSNRVIALFSHGDPIKLVFAYFLGVPLDLFTRIEISPGSYSILRLEDRGPQVLAINRLP
ncbi:MAG: histidine phosphatase family protein [Limisphaerales bacterium]